MKSDVLGARVECKAVSADEACVACDDDERDAAFCARNGWKHQVRCVEASATGENQTYLDAETHSYLTYQPCPLSFDSFVRFELLMMVCFMCTFYYVQKRKRWLKALQEYRLASHV